MKLFMKLYLGMIALLVFALLTSSYFVVKTTLEQNLQHEIDSGMERHNMMINSFHTNLLFATRDKPATKNLVIRVVGLTKGTSDIPCIVAMDDAIVYIDTVTAYEPGRAEREYVSYRNVTIDGSTFIVYYSYFSLGDIKYTFVTESNITGIIEENNLLRDRYLIIYLLVLLSGTIIALFYSIRLTRPVRRLRNATEKMVKGDYSARITKISKDEFGLLSMAYNEMAETIQDKVDALNLSVKQKEDFVAAFAHETKTPMTSIIGYADLLYQDRLPEDKKKEAAFVMLNEGLRLQALSRKLLDIIALEKNKIFREETSLSDMVMDIEKTLQVKAEEKHVDIRYDIPDDYLYLDYDLFKTVIVNLIDNSIKAGADKITFSGKRENKDFIFSVSDNGIGIPEEELGRVKDAFYMVDKSRSRAEHGAGLGLALSEKIVRLHHGKIDIDSTYGQGTTIKIILNTADDPDSYDETGDDEDE